MTTCICQYPWDYTIFDACRLNKVPLRSLEELQNEIQTGKKNSNLLQMHKTILQCKVGKLLSK